MGNKYSSDKSHKESSVADEIIADNLKEMIATTKLIGASIKRRSITQFEEFITSKKINLNILTKEYEINI